MMSPENKKVDILSNLPGDAIDAILLHLPLLDAVRTSILSKKWRYKWCTLPELTLHLGNLIIRSDSIPPTYEFANIIYHLLTLHAGPITKFTFSCFPLKTCPNIDNLIYFLSRNGIQHLVLELTQLTQHTQRYKFPSSIFTCSQMRHLTLTSCSIQLPPPAFQGFDWLISLELCWVTISSEFLESLISHCPLLERLVLGYLDFSNAIEIKAPMLRSMDFTGEITSICVKNSPLVEKLFLRGSGSSKVERTCDIATFFESFTALELLHLDHHCLKVLAVGTGEVPKWIPFNLSCVKRLSLDWISFDELDVVSCALCLIRSAPSLQYIDIQGADGEDGEYYPALESLEVESFSDVSFCHLKEAKLALFVGSKPEMQLIKLLLAKSPMMLTMQIHLALVDEEPRSFCKAIKISAELNSFRRASPKVKVVYDVTFCGDE